MRELRDSPWQTLKIPAAFTLWLAPPVGLVGFGWCISRTNADSQWNPSLQHISSKVLLWKRNDSSQYQNEEETEI